MIALLGPWVFGFSAVNGPSFTQSMVAAGPIYLAQAVFLSFVVMVLVSGAIGLAAELVLAPNSPRELRVWQMVGIAGCLAVAVLATVGIVVPALRWLW